MIRWSYVLPRLGILIGLFLTAHFGVPLLLRWTMVHAVETTTGMAVDVERTWASVVRGRMQVNQVQIAVSPSSDRNLIEFESAVFAMDLGALSQRHWVVDEAEIRGIQLNTLRNARSGSEGLRFDVPMPDLEQLTETGRDVSRQWLGHISRNLERRVEDEFESIQLARQLSQRWPADYEALELQVCTCRDSAERLHRALSGPVTMPTNERELAALKRRWDEVRQLHGEITRLREQLDDLVSQVAQDQDAIKTAFSRDREKLQAAIRLVELDGEKLNRYLLDSEAYRLWAQVQPWLEAVRWLTESPELEEEVDRGTIVRYDGDLPGFLIRKAKLDGQAVINGHDFHFVGQAEQLTTDSRKLTQPTRIHLATDGPFQATIDAEFDCSTDVPQQSILFKCVGVPMAARSCGLHDTLAVAMGPCLADVGVKVVVRGDQLSGRILLAERGLQLQPIVGAQLGGRDLQLSLTEALGAIDHFKLVIDISGTVDAPCWTIHSDLGPRLRTGLQDAFQMAVNRHAQRLAEEADRRLGQQVSQLETLLAAKRTDLTRELGIGDDLLSGLAKSTASRVNPLDRLIRRF